MEYIKREKNGAIQAFFVKHINNLVARAYCHKVHNELFYTLMTEPCLLFVFGNYCRRFFYGLMVSMLCRSCGFQVLLKICPSQ